MKLGKYLELTTNYDKQTCEKMIKQKLVKVNNNLVNNPKLVIKELTDIICLNDVPLLYEKYIYLMMNKRAGLISATKDNFQDTVFLDLKEYQNRDLKLVGRLDKDTEGLLLITDDGEFIHHLTSPKHNIVKTYYVRYSGKPILNISECFEQGIILENGEKCLPGLFEEVSSNEALVSINEGKFHQVKKMCAACGIKVEYLKRISIGSLRLDENLGIGQYRKLTKEEIEALSK